MKRIAFLVGCLFALSMLCGCSGGGDVTEGGALEKHEQMKKATEASVDKDAIDKSRN